LRPGISSRTGRRKSASLRDGVPKLALHAKIRGRTVQDIARDVLKLSREGLEARDRQGCKGKTEAAFLDTLDETVATGKTSAENLLALYNGNWHQDVTRVFRDFAY